MDEDTASNGLYAMGKRQAEETAWRGGNLLPCRLANCPPERRTICFYQLIIQNVRRPALNVDLLNALALVGILFRIVIKIQILITMLAVLRGVIILTKAKRKVLIEGKRQARQGSEYT